MIDTELAAKVNKYDDSFVQRHNAILMAVNDCVVEERAASPWLVDQDVIEAYKALTATMKTLASGIYYESLPESNVRLSLFRRLKTMLEQRMAPETTGQPVLKVSEAIDILDFLTFAAQANSSVRPRSRRYLDWICETFGYPQPQHSSGLIIP